ncbi:Hypothetical protein Bdt_0755 [Bdellovibrio bacteriovorus str. Tiberius]|uniref:Uncharacterized protein n=1 Tax=Bdellovibrio bacteriovorus str. Tiberius TaxID=1069642 RepID=K7ZEH3_BDEBC|nr:Hypothetical protein Bdt_0755 [Bdellovibrio bacteriovorus str. Tiberius]
MSDLGYGGALGDWLKSPLSRAFLRFGAGACESAEQTHKLG